MTAPFWTVFVGYSTPLLVDFMHPGHFSGTAKPDGFRETHIVVVPKSQEALPSELRNSNDGFVLGRFRRL